jgi:uncharacterized cupredoxin-like copper-binding protein
MQGRSNMNVLARASTKLAESEKLVTWPAARTTTAHEGDPPVRMKPRSRRPRALPASLIALAVALLLAAGCSTRSGTNATREAENRGSAPTAPAAPAAGMIEIAMVDHAFDPAEITVARGEPATLRFTNKGSVVHEALVGDAAAQASHEADMSEDASSHSHDHAMMADEPHNAPSVLELDPGTSGTITHVFDQSGTIEIACHEPGHYAAGMKIVVNVV